LDSFGGEIVIPELGDSFDFAMPTQKPSCHESGAPVLKRASTASFDVTCEVKIGNSLEVLRDTPDETFQCCVTSPPYWGLRDYGIRGQIGAEGTVKGYIESLVTVFREVRRTLRSDGTLWLNIGDSYTSGGRTWRDTDKKNPARGMAYRAPTPEGLKPKDLIGVPWKLAFALQEDGWYLRSDIVWNKPNAQPESVKDRPTRSHEYVFLMTKSEKYYYDHASIVEATADPKKTRNRRSVWAINTEPSKEAHFAMFPPKLVELCIEAGSKPESYVLDPFFGSGTVGIVATQLGRNCVGIELKDEFAAIARRRLEAIQPRLQL
jgi:site-specific DNA-methyltransferase (adenine-specific)/site-specific DNA-methyltransferase (cytosine-N4-specific)